MAPPFAGATKLLDTYLHGLNDLNTFLTEFHYFGQTLLFRSAPVLSELRPKPIFSKLKEDNEYTQFVKVIKDRIDLEDCIFKGNCDEKTIANRTKEFDELFESYLPSLSSNICKEDTNPENKFERKCFLNIYDIFDQPMVIQVDNTTDIDENNFNKTEYCNKNPTKCFYNIEKGGERRSIEELYSMGNYTYNLSQMQEFFDTYNQNKEIYGLKENVTLSDFETEEEFRKENLLQIAHQNNISLTNDLPIPPIDTDIIYSPIVSTMAGKLLEDDVVQYGKTIHSGGDGTVSTWSSVLVGLKWIYDKNMNDLPQKIRLVEYCSKLSKDFPYNETNNFIALGCGCLENNEYNNLDDCSHQSMLFDSNIITYIKNVSSNETNITNDRVNAAKRALSINDMTQYEQKCNLVLVHLADSSEYSNILSSNDSNLPDLTDLTDLPSSDEEDDEDDTDNFYPEKTGANMYKLNIILAFIGLLSYISI